MGRPVHGSGVFTGGAFMHPTLSFMGRVRLSTGPVVRSKENKNVPPFGVVPGGS
jgi:hypothetical protein